MKINTSMLKRPEIKGKLLITSKHELPDGNFAYTGVRLGTLGGTPPVGFVDAKSRGIYSLTTAPRNILVIDGLQINQILAANSPESLKDNNADRLSPKRVDELRHGVGKDILLGATGIGVTHLLQKGGAVVATPYVVDALGAAGDANAVKVIGKILAESEIARYADVLGRVVKILILLFTLFGISIKILELFFKDDVPGWAWIVSSFVNLALTIIFGLYLFDVGPFATAP